MKNNYFLIYNGCPYLFLKVEVICPYLFLGTITLNRVKCIAPAVIIKMTFLVDIIFNVFSQNV